MSKHRWTIEDLQAKGLTIAGKDIAEKPKPNPTAKERHQALGRMKAGKMNKTEALYAKHLEALKSAGEVAAWWFEPMNLRLADRCFYQIDFLVLKAGGQLEVHEVKGGYIMDDSLVKLKTAAEKFPFRFLMAQWKGKEWVMKEF